MRPKHRPPRPKHPKFTHFHRSGLRFGRFPTQHRSIGGVGRPRRDRRAWLRHPWVVAGPGRASRRRTEPENSDQAPLVWRARRDLPRCRWAVAGPGRIARQRAKPDLSTPGPTGVEGAEGSGGPGRGAGGRWRGLAGLRDRPLRAAGSRVAISRAGRRPRAHQAARPNKAHEAPGTPVGSEATTTRRPRRAARAGSGRGSG